MTTKKATAATSKQNEGLTEAEREAMKTHLQDQKAAKARAKAGKVDDEPVVLERIAEMPEPDRGLAARIHAIIKENAPELKPRLWYGMPAYSKDGKVLCFFQAASKFDARYASLGFNDVANLDDGTLWPVAFAVTELSEAVEAKIAALVRKAVG